MVRFFLTEVKNILRLAFGFFVVEKLGFDLFEVIEDFVEILGDPFFVLGSDSSILQSL